MMNHIGKTLVVINMGLSGLFLAFAIGIASNQIDWGWNEPRLEYGQRIASEIDKRTAAYKQAWRAKKVVEDDLTQAQGMLNNAQFAWYNYNLWAAQELESLYSATKERQIKRVKLNNGQLVLDPKKLGVPLLQDPVIFNYNDGKNVEQIKVTKSLKAYYAKLSALENKMKAENENLQNDIRKQRDLTFILNGQVGDPAKKKKKSHGLYELVEEEIARQKLLRKEIEDIRPLWVRKLVDAQLLLERRKRLEARLQELMAQSPAQGQ